MLGVGFSLSDTAGRVRGPAALPAVAITTVVIEGDSITSNQPNTPNGFYSYQYGDARPDRTIFVRAQGSRTVGSAAELNDDGNTLIGNVAEDVAYGPQLLTAMIGANDMALGSAATYRANLTNLAAQYRAAGVKFAWSPPLPYNPVGVPHPNYANFTAQRGAILATARDPAVWGQWADHYLPLGEHPDFADPALAEPLFGDSVHPSAAGQSALFAVYRAAMDSILDASRANATGPYESVWPVSETHLAAATGIVRRFIVSGIAHGGLAGGVTVAGADAQVRLNGGAWGAGTGRTYNGDVIDLKLTTSADSSTTVAIDLTIGGEARTLGFATGASVTPASYAHGGIAAIQPAGTVHSWSALSFDATGIALLALKASQPGPVSVEIAVAGSGSWVPAIRQFVQPVDYQPGLEVWAIPIGVAGARDVRVTYGGFRGQTALSWGVVRDADPVPVQIAHNAPAHQSQPHATPTLTVPASGIAVAFFGEYGGASIIPATVAAGTSAVAEGHGSYQGETYGVAVATRTTSGTAGWNYVFGTHPRGAIVFKAAGS